ncbi:hypothetical protein CEXT_369291 [Caerostris extrusa]|uniref:Uncharacterized protein n=1 Tax=Caerostris extrusa TaxID=172846 RepID=A0AAV4XKD9_CAEEX|nr:hypothetical protein CEXT_369291 [Caerostris extrusa]
MQHVRYSVKGLLRQQPNSSTGSKHADIDPTVAGTEPSVQPTHPWQMEMKHSHRICITKLKHMKLGNRNLGKFHIILKKLLLEKYSGHGIVSIPSK